MRVQIPAYTDSWMQGDRYGDVVKITNGSKRRAGVRAALLNGAHGKVEIAHVTLDKSRRTIRVILDDCTVID